MQFGELQRLEKFNLKKKLETVSTTVTWKLKMSDVSIIIHTRVV